ncbi:uncharacterized protein LOC100367476 [Saccoglossus kowalevskii]|uniref:Uncharacterized protein LOC100367476 n=1 Tax=Saccoglossus kowalevskii TaxID=10224 RepID=A0ABM0GWE1_SACKO|nr:PREDICTED: uncharacterized protein LOC100367476 [Saccoglossus kowalevskii]
MADTLLDLAQNEIVFSDTSASCDVRWQHSVPTNSIGIQSIPEMNDASTQTDRSQDADIVALKIENLCLKNELMDLKSKKNNSSKKKHFSVEDVSDDDVKCKFYTGLTWLQLLCLWDFLGRATNKLSLWSRPMKHNEESPSKRPGPKRKLEPMNELFLTLVRLRLGLLHSDLAYRFGISKGKVSSTVITWVQCMFLQFCTLKDSMFPSRDILKKSLPKCFKKYKNVRSIIDCTEIFVQTATNFQQQGNLYSTYKSHPTFKVGIVGIAPNGAVTYLSDLFEGAASDRNIVIESGFLDKLEPGDLILADRGFTIRDVLFDKKADLNIPPFLHGRDRFTVQEEAETKQIAKVRIHVERAIERLKKYRLFQKTIPLSLAPVVSQMFFVVGCLVNFQEPLVS